MLFATPDPRKQQPTTMYRGKRSQVKGAERQGIKPNQMQDGSYDHKQDPRLKNFATGFGVFVLIFLFSGKFMEYMVDRFIFGNANAAEDITKKVNIETSVQLLKGAKFGDLTTGKPDTFQSQE